MQPIIFSKDEKCDGLKPVNLVLEYKDGITPQLVCVDSKGELVCELLEFLDDGVYSMPDARSKLEAAGYSTDFSSWNVYGAIQIYGGVE